MAHWTDLLEDAAPIRAIFGDAPPSLHGVDLHEVVVSWDGPSVSLRLDTAEFPASPPPKWAKLNTVQLTLEAFPVETMSMSDVIPRTGPVDLDIRRETPSRLGASARRGRPGNNHRPKNAAAPSIAHPSDCPRGLRPDPEAEGALLVSQEDQRLPERRATGAVSRRSIAPSPGSAKWSGYRRRHPQGTFLNVAQARVLRPTTELPFIPD
jgi:Immunity protein 50